jgi:FkbM family methyltransferase
VLRGVFRHRSFLASLERDYESFSMELFVAALSPGVTVVDGGSHIGLFSVTALERQPQLERLLAFEPDPHNFSALGANLAPYGARPVQAKRSALADRPGTAEFYASSGTISSSLFARRLPAGQWRRSEVPTTTIDSELEGARLGPLAIKLDVEGAEPLAVAGMRRSVERAETVLVLAEVNSDALRAGGHSPSDLVGALRDCGLDVAFVDESARELRDPSVPGGLPKGNLLARKP